MLLMWRDIIITFFDLSKDFRSFYNRHTPGNKNKRKKMKNLLAKNNNNIETTKMTCRFCIVRGVTFTDFYAEVAGETITTL